MFFADFISASRDFTQYLTSGVPDLDSFSWRVHLRLRARVRLKTLSSPLNRDPVLSRQTIRGKLRFGRSSVSKPFSLIIWIQSPWGKYLSVTYNTQSSDFVIYLVDFHSTKRALWLVDSWSRAADQIQMYPDRDTIAQLLPARRIQQHAIGTWLN